MTASNVTTIKVTKALRDRITAGAAEQDQTVQKFVEQVMDERDRSQRLAAVAAAMSGNNEKTLRAWREEADHWATLDTDIDGGQ